LQIIFKQRRNGILGKKFWKAFTVLAVLTVVVLFLWIYLEEIDLMGDGGSTGESGLTGSEGEETINTEGYENFYGVYGRDYQFPYGGEIKISLYENGRYEIYEMYTQTNGYYRQVTETGTYTKTVGADSEEILMVWLFEFNPTNSSGIRNGEYFTLNMGYYTENLWKDTYIFYGHKKDGISEPTLYMLSEDGGFALNRVIPTYTLSYIAGTGGVLTGDSYQEVKQGKNGTSVTAVANEGYEFTQWSDGVKTATRQDKNVQSSISVVAEFTQTSYVYRYFAGVDSGRGEIVLSSEKATISNNYTVTATAVAEDGWGFYAWSDGVKTATRTDVLTGDFQIEAIFAREITLIVVTEGGSVSCNGQQGKTLKILLTEDAIEMVTAIADEGYYFWGWAIRETLDPWYFSQSLYLDYNNSYSVYYLKFKRLED
jgi:hypothetical protein